jgi:hypothetical protein
VLKTVDSVGSDPRDWSQPGSGKFHPVDYQVLVGSIRWGARRGDPADRPRKGRDFRNDNRGFA